MKKTKVLSIIYETNPWKYIVIVVSLANFFLFLDPNSILAFALFIIFCYLTFSVTVYLYTYLDTKLLKKKSNLLESLGEQLDLYFQLKKVKFIISKLVLVLNTTSVMYFNPKKLRLTKLPQFTNYFNFFTLPTLLNFKKNFTLNPLYINSFAVKKNYLNN